MFATVTWRYIYSWRNCVVPVPCEELPLAGWRRRGRRRRRTCTDRSSREETRPTQLHTQQIRRATATFLDCGQITSTSPHYVTIIRLILTTIQTIYQQLVLEMCGSRKFWIRVNWRISTKHHVHVYSSMLYWICCPNASCTTYTASFNEKNARGDANTARWQ